MLAEARDRIEPLVASGKTVDEAIAAKPLAPLDAKWGRGLFKGSHFTKLVYSGLAQHRASFARAAIAEPGSSSGKDRSRSLPPSGRKSDADAGRDFLWRIPLTPIPRPANFGSAFTRRSGTTAGMSRNSTRDSTGWICPSMVRRRIASESSLVTSHLGIARGNAACLSSR